LNVPLLKEAVTAYGNVKTKKWFSSVLTHAGYRHAG
jgi:hypothetical protein